MPVSRFGQDVALDIFAVFLRTAVLECSSLCQTRKNQRDELSVDKPPKFPDPTLRLPLNRGTPRAASLTMKKHTSLAKLRRATQEVIQVQRMASVRQLVRMDSADDLVVASKREEENPPPLELDRVAMRLDGFEMYSFLASLISGFSYGCLAEFDANEAFKAKLPPPLCDLLSLCFVVTMMASIFCGLYSTCVFALCSLYSKTALAELKDGRMRVSDLVP